jgi:hypothetical protein
MHIVKRARATVQEGGAEHSGWLPSDSSAPAPTPLRTVTYLVRILDIGSGFLLDYLEEGAPHGFDSWFETLQDAERAARDEFGLQESDWET